MQELAAAPAWSPDGERLAFVRATGPGGAILVMPVLGGEERQVATTCKGDIPDVAWSPDGGSLLFADREAGAPSAVFRVELLSGRRQRLTLPPATSTGDRDLALSRGGGQLAFARATAPGVEERCVERWRRSRGAAACGPGARVDRRADAVLQSRRCSGAVAPGEARRATVAWAGDPRSRLRGAGPGLRLGPRPAARLRAAHRCPPHAPAGDPAPPARQWRAGGGVAAAARHVICATSASLSRRTSGG